MSKIQNLFSFEDHVEKILRNKLDELLLTEPKYRELITLYQALGWVQDLTTLRAELVTEEVAPGICDDKGQQVPACTMLKLTLAVPVAPVSAYPSWNDVDISGVKSITSDAVLV